MVKVSSAVAIVFLADGFCFKTDTDYRVVYSNALLLFMFLVD